MFVARRHLVLSAVVSFGMVFSACGGADNGLPGSASTTSADTTESSVVVATGVVDTTDSVATTDAVDLSDEFPVFTSAELLAALPTLDELGGGWSDIGDTPVVDPEPDEGTGVGICGGPNGAARALTSGVSAIVLGPNQLGPDERTGTTSIYVFPDVVMAQGFIDLTADTADCPDGIAWERIQKSNPVEPNEFSGFSPGFEDITENQIWNFTENASSAYGEGGTDVLFVTSSQARELTAVDITFGQVDTTLLRLDRYDNVVIATSITGVWDKKGYIDLAESVNFQPTDDDLDEYTQLALPPVLDRLGWE